MSDVLSEHVLVVPTSLLHQLGYFQGFLAAAEAHLETLLSGHHASYRPRAQMERDPSFKQLIPYVIFCHRPDSGRPAVFCYTRGTGQGEQRLHRKKSVGVGGHICAEDALSHQPYVEGMRRELAEEVIIGAGYRERCVGLINDDQTEVGQVHLGVVHLCELDAPDIRPRETEIVEAGFQPVDRLLADLDGFETWSQICLTALFGSRVGQDDVSEP